MHFRSRNNHAKNQPNILSNKEITAIFHSSNSKVMKKKKKKKKKKQKEPEWRLGAALTLSHSSKTAAASISAVSFSPYMLFEFDKRYQSETQS